jgi:hypothetical protein
MEKELPIEPMLQNDPIDPMERALPNEPRERQEPSLSSSTCREKRSDRGTSGGVLPPESLRRRTRARKDNPITATTMKTMRDDWLDIRLLITPDYEVRTARGQTRRRDLRGPNNREGLLADANTDDGVKGWIEPSHDNIQFTRRNRDATLRRYAVTDV